MHFIVLFCVNPFSAPAQVHPLPVPPRHGSMGNIISSVASSGTSSKQLPPPPPLPPKKHSLLMAQLAMAKLNEMNGGGKTSLNKFRQQSAGKMEDNGIGNGGDRFGHTVDMPPAAANWYPKSAALEVLANSRCSSSSPSSTASSASCPSSPSPFSSAHQNHFAAKTTTINAAPSAADLPSKEFGLSAAISHGRQKSLPNVVEEERDEDFLQPIKQQKPPLNSRGDGQKQQLGGGEGQRQRQSAGGQNNGGNKPASGGNAHGQLQNSPPPPHSLSSSPSLTSLQNCLYFAAENPEKHSWEQLEELEKRRLQVGFGENRGAM